MRPRPRWPRHPPRHSTRTRAPRPVHWCSPGCDRMPQDVSLRPRMAQSKAHAQRPREAPRSGAVARRPEHGAVARLARRREAGDYAQHAAGGLAGTVGSGPHPQPTPPAAFTSASRAQHASRPPGAGPPQQPRAAAGAGGSCGAAGMFVVWVWAASVISVSLWLGECAHSQVTQEDAEPSRWTQPGYLLLPQVPGVHPRVAAGLPLEPSQPAPPRRRR